MESYILQYKNISIKIIEFLKDNKIQEAEELINERENILEYINKLYKSGATINENDKNELKQIDLEIYNIIYHIILCYIFSFYAHDNTKIEICT